MSATGSAFQGFQRHHPSGDKVKFTVSVHGHQWSSARHIHETLQEFARVIERNARRLEFIGQGETIQRLQLARPDGSEPEELDVDATLEDVLICMGEKQLVAIITSGVATKDDGDGELPPCVSASQELPKTKALFPKHDTPTSYSITPTSAPSADDLESPTPGCSKASPPGYGGLPLRGLKISIPSCDYSPDDADFRQAKSMCGSGGGFTGMLNHATTPSPAELAQFLVRGSSTSRPGSNGRFGPCTTASMPVFSNTQAAYQSFRPFPASTPGCAPNIALLAQFLAAQLKAFTPAQTPMDSSGKPQANNELGTSSLQHRGVTTAQPPQTPKPEQADVNNSKQPKGDCQDDRDASSSSANVNNPPSGAEDADQSKGRSELVFLVNRRSKMGVGTHHLKMSDLSAYFHLSIVDAAKKLGVSQTTLKKACRKFGLKRWPGRKVRSLESTIHGLEHTIAVGQGAGMEDLTEAYMRSEVLKLQQEMDQLVHGIPAVQVSRLHFFLFILAFLRRVAKQDQWISMQQHLPMVRTADLYKRLYSRGWRSKFHSPCNGQFDLDLNASCKGDNATNIAVGDNEKDCAWKLRQDSENRAEGRQEMEVADLAREEEEEDEEEDRDREGGAEDRVEERKEEPTAKRPKVQEFS